jgi:hypothetical protein
MCGKGEGESQSEPKTTRLNNILDYLQETLSAPRHRWRSENKTGHCLESIIADTISCIELSAQRRSIPTIHSKNSRTCADMLV